MLRNAPFCALALVVAACASGPGPAPGKIARDLDERMNEGLASGIGAGQIAVQKLPDGVSILVAEQALFAPGTADLTEQGRDVLTGVIQDLVDPSLLRIVVATPSASAGDLQAARAQAVTRYLAQPTQYALPGALAPSVQPYVVMLAPQPAGPAAPALAITVRANPGAGDASASMG